MQISLKCRAVRWNGWCVNQFRLPISGAGLRNPYTYTHKHEQKLESRTMLKSRILKRAHWKHSMTIWVQFNDFRPPGLLVIRACAKCPSRIIDMISASPVFFYSQSMKCFDLMAISWHSRTFKVDFWRREPKTTYLYGKSDFYPLSVWLIGYW